MRAAAPRPAAAAALALALAAGACTTVHGTGEGPIVREFEIRGTDALDEDDVRERLATQPDDPWWHLFWRDAWRFDEDAFANDRRRVERLYQAEGFYGARVVEAEAVRAGDGIRARMRVEEGPPTRVAELVVAGLDGAPEAKAFLGDRLPLAPGDRFTERAYDATRERIAQALGATGYARAEIDQLARVNPDTGEATVVYTVAPGQRYRFGSVFVTGTAVIPNSRIRQEASLVFKPGEWFDDREIDAVQRRIFDLGVFGGVRVSQGPPDERGTIPVVVQLREAPFRTVRAGPGVGIGATRWDANVIAGWTHRNWRGGLRRLSLDGRLGYAWLPNPFAPATNGFVGLTSAEFTQPGLIRRRADFNARVGVERGLEPAYSFWAERLRVGTPLKLWRVLSIFPSYNLELYQLTGTPRTVVGAQGRDELLQNCSGQNCLLSYLEQRAELDLRDDAINTRRGLFLGFAIQEGFQVLGQGFPYLRLLPEARAYVPLGRSTVVAGRVRVGALRRVGSGEPPVVARFYSGGPNLMRGYYTRQLSPVVSTLDRGYVPVGGEGLVDGGLELRLGVRGTLGGVVFLDFGNVAPTVAESLDVGRLQYAAGVGLRYQTIVGPIRLELATRIPRRTGGGWGLPTVPVVGDENPAGLLREHAEPRFAVHLSIGPSF